MRVRVVRLLRQKYGISQHAFAKVCGISQQRVGEIELDLHKGATEKTQERLVAAFNTLISQKDNEAEELRIALQRNKDSLLKWVEEHEYEI